MVKIAAGICTYSDSLGLARLLDSLAGARVDSIVIHGPFPSYYSLDSESSSSTDAICRAYPNIRLIDLVQPMPEVERRQTYLDLANNYDFLLVIDSDEFICDGADWPLFRKNCERLLESGKHHYIYDVAYDSTAPSNAGPKPRIFREPSKIRYYKKHYWWLLPNGRVAAGGSDSVTIVEGIRLMHDDSLRSPDRIKAKEQYQVCLLREESKQILP